MKFRITIIVAPRTLTLVDSTVKTDHLHRLGLELNPLASGPVDCVWTF